MCGRLLLLLACLGLCHGHAVVPVVPAAHSYHGLVAPYPLVHHGYAGHGLLGHGVVAGPVGHHLWKRSPHYVAPLAPLAHVAPVAVSHQSRVDVHSSPALVAPVLPVPLLHKTVVASPLHYGAGIHGGLYPHVGHY
ncbi:uncharacterized protein LOC125231812 [Leguminivora glycinivorella]|uniref:uncharacterized protein LOC125231812 n=1 Tax=Leguminivora glycinivorella TaxID=1035111 RepID=UPI00200F3D18|nr:uncharacterized protein LOC125231812 [Leguminivora glycinivorella]